LQRGLQARRKTVRETGVYYRRRQGALAQLPALCTRRYRQRRPTAQRESRNTPAEQDYVKHPQLVCKEVAAGVPAGCQGGAGHLEDLRRKLQKAPQRGPVQRLCDSRSTRGTRRGKVE